MKIDLEAISAAFAPVRDRIPVLQERRETEQGQEFLDLVVPMVEEALAITQQYRDYFGVRWVNSLSGYWEPVVLELLYALRASLLPLGDRDKVQKLVELWLELGEFMGRSRSVATDLQDGYRQVLYHLIARDSSLESHAEEIANLHPSDNVRTSFDYYVDYKNYRSGRSQRLV